MVSGTIFIHSPNHSFVVQNRLSKPGWKILFIFDPTRIYFTIYCFIFGCMSCSIKILWRKKKQNWIRKSLPFPKKPFQTQIVYDFDQYNLHIGICNYIVVLDFCFLYNRSERNCRCLFECSGIFISGNMILIPYCTVL